LRDIYCDGSGQAEVRKRKSAERTSAKKMKKNEEK